MHVFMSPETRKLRKHACKSETVPRVLSLQYKRFQPSRFKIKMLSLKTVFQKFRLNSVDSRSDNFFGSKYANLHNFQIQWTENVDSVLKLIIVGHRYF